VLERIREPPMGGDKEDYVKWGLATVGVTRAWCAPLEMGIGTVTLRFMCDVLRAGEFSTEIDSVGNIHGIGGGYPTDEDVVRVVKYLDNVRPVAVKDFFVSAPLVQLYDITIANLEIDDAATRGAIEAGIREMEVERLFPGCTVWRSWVDEAISQASRENHHDLIMEDVVMPTPGYLGRLDTITWA
jgi:uncharacterized phage protein gp47/JayE